MVLAYDFYIDLFSDSRSRGKYYITEIITELNKNSSPVIFNAVKKYIKNFGSEKIDGGVETEKEQV